MLILTTCFYNLNGKFDIKTYESWFKNLLTNVVNFKLVVYTNLETEKILIPYINNNPNIKIILREYDEFYNYKYKTMLIKNQEHNIYLKNVDWKVIMLWLEKIFFVKETIAKKYFEGEWHGWCDIGYFRGRYKDIDSKLIKKWPNDNKINNLNNNKIYYTLVNKNNFLEYISTCLIKNERGLPKTPIKGDQISIAGGFFLCHKDKVDWWFDTFNDKVKLYLDNDYLIKDDQMIILNCVVENFDNFRLITEYDIRYDNWFLFQRYLL